METGGEEEKRAGRKDSACFKALFIRKKSLKGSCRKCKKLTGCGVI